jgi:anti-sigma regulatory factor (Ser/Thr protein kinase)
MERPGLGWCCSDRDQRDIGNVIDTASAFRHEAIFYDGDDGFVAGTMPFLREGIEGGEPILVVVGSEKIELLRHELGPDADRIRFADMAGVGRNPARIIPAWTDFVDEAGATGRSFRGIGEPIWAGRTPEELVECERHEALLNLAFGGDPAWRLACPYDTTALAPAVLQEAERNHPYLRDIDGERVSQTYWDLPAIAAPFDRALPEPPASAETLTIDAARMSDARRFVGERAQAWGLTLERADDLVLAAGEVATNTIRHGGGEGLLRMWEANGSVICEIADQGSITDPLAGRRHPRWDTAGGFGLWLANQVCDLVQVRTFATGSVVRLHVGLGS